jgi:N-formylglutamate deformylase
MTPLFTLVRGESHLLVSVPHAGTYLPPDIAHRLTPAGLAMPDTDWHVDRLADFAPALGATLLVATHSRIVIDLNRATDGALLYPGKIETGLCPIESFAGEPFYAGAPPSREEVEARTAQYWQPYHDALQSELARLKALHGRAHLLDLHSIASRVPRLFDGRLPDLNIGTNDGRSADPALIARVAEAARRDPSLSMVLNGRFKGGAITRGYGNPAAGVHAIQIEIAQAAYMVEAAPFPFDAVLARPVRTILHDIAEVF